MTRDFSKIRSNVNRAITELKEQDNMWHWRAVVNKTNIMIYWGYLQHCNCNNNHFTIQMIDKEMVNGDDLVVALDEHNEYMTGGILGNKCWHDGNLGECVEKLIKEIGYIAHHNY